METEKTKRPNMPPPSMRPPTMPPPTPPAYSEKVRSKAEAPSNVELSKLPLLEPEDGVFNAYSNVVNMNWTLTDVRLRFGELLQVPDDDRPTWENQHGILLERVSVAIPWHQAKVLRDMLAGITRNYEEINGDLKPIKLPAPVSPPSSSPPSGKR